jgi:hypothetical protein
MKRIRETRNSSLLQRRIKAIGGGAFFLLLGLLLQLRGRLAWTNYYGQNIFSAGILAFGGVIIVLALLPDSWVAKLAVVDKKRPVRFHHDSASHSGKD